MVELSYRRDSVLLATRFVGGNGGGGVIFKPPRAQSQTTRACFAESGGNCFTTRDSSTPFSKVFWPTDVVRRQAVKTKYLYLVRV